MIKCLIVDDEPLAIQLIKHHIDAIEDLEVIGETHHPLEALNIIREKEIDLLFLDIQMPVLTGLEIVKNIKNLPPVIFTTAYRDHAVESYEYDVVDYLVKPITLPRFIKAIEKFRARNIVGTDPDENAPLLQSSQIVIDHFYVNENKKYHKVYFKDILYLESLKEYVKIHLDKNSVVTKSTMDVMAGKLPEQFLRIHRSFIVNTKAITAFTTHDIEIGVKEIPIGGSYKEKVRSRLMRG